MAKKIVKQERCIFCMKHPCECPKTPKKDSDVKNNDHAIRPD